MTTLEWLSRLIQFNTISSNPNIALIRAVQAWFDEHQLQSTIIPTAIEGKVNLFATIPASNGKTEGGLLLASHTDVVPVGGQLWHTDPFVAIEREGKIFGRGTSDMKGFMAVCLALVPEFCRLSLKKPIHFSFSCDEEIGCIGVDFVVDYFLKNDIRPEGCIVGEPTLMRPIIGEKARRVYHCQVQGKSAHSSLVGEGCNAILYASRLICFINTLAEQTKEDGPFDHDFDCPFSTITTNIISGGIATNVIPGTCEFIVEVRYLNTFSLLNFTQQIEQFIHHELLPEMQKTQPEAAIYFDETSDALGFDAEESATITQTVRSVTGIKERFKVSYATEAGFFQNAHIPTVICGPGNIQQAHKPNEFVSIEQLNWCDEVLRKVVLSFCGIETINNPSS